ncbi:RNA-binding domain-containing protein [Leuconostoc mesenteroides]|uniref:RNA-binding domain-containing protein n=1 Tax=Leuconostoc mesenteroides TaxID=1245 RepID=UPI0032DED86E
MYWKEEGNTLDMNDATHIINSRIEENEWLDYKQEWHQNKIELVRDILSFANTVHSRDCYLIFGVVDKTIEVIGTREVLVY